MGEIADSLISGEFDYITGEYLGEEVGYPRTRAYGRREYVPPVEKKPTSKANVCISNMCKDRGFDNRPYISYHILVDGDEKFGGKTYRTE